MSQQEKVRNSNFSSRLRAAREFLGITQENLGKAWGLTGDYIYMLESGRKPFPKKWELKVIELEDEVRKKTGFDLAELTGEKGAENILSIGDRLEGDVRLADSAPPYLAPRQVPVVGYVAGANMLSNRAFNFGDMANQIEDYFTTECRDPNALALIVEGDSMHPEIQAGDWIVVAPNSEPRHGKPAVARLKEEGSAVLKRFFRSGLEGRTIRLESTNPDYQPIVKDITEFQFIYPVVDLKRRIA